MELIRKLITDLESRIEALERNLTIKKITIPSDGYLVIKKVSSDPSSPVDGELWLNTTTNLFKVRINGVTKTVTVS